MQDAEEDAKRLNSLCNEPGLDYAGKICQGTTTQKSELIQMDLKTLKHHCKYRSASTRKVLLDNVLYSMDVNVFCTGIKKEVSITVLVMSSEFMSRMCELGSTRKMNELMGIISSSCKQYNERFAITPEATSQYVLRSTTDVCGRIAGVVDDTIVAIEEECSNADYVFFTFYSLFDTLKEVRQFAKANFDSYRVLPNAKPGISEIINPGSDENKAFTIKFERHILTYKALSGQFTNIT